MLSPENRSLLIGPAILVIALMILIGWAGKGVYDAVTTIFYHE